MHAATPRWSPVSFAVILASCFSLAACVGGGGGGGLLPIPGTDAATGPIGGGSGGRFPFPLTDAGGGCTPTCGERNCGPDGCGAQCGTCTDGALCSVDGLCVAAPRNCGDEACGNDEDCSTCPADCGQCCGNEVCSVTETCTTCPADCGCADDQTCDPVAGQCVAACTPSCGDRVCGGDGCEGRCGECSGGDVCSAEGQCVPPAASCGDEICGADEDCSICPADCGQCCGNAECAGAENCETCPADCGCVGEQTCRAARCVDAGPSCGDGQCNGAEDCRDCPGDCGACCGNGICANGEDCQNCAADCRCVGEEQCREGVCIPPCPVACDAWSSTCTDDGAGYRLCVPDPDDPICNETSRRIPCADGRDCRNGRCRGLCLAPQVVFLVDRSSSMEGPRWEFTQQALLAFSATFARRVRVAVRTFPGGNACGAANLGAFQDAPFAAFAGMPGPSEQAQTPISAAFEGLENAFGDPDEGESVILITDGDETCAEESDVIDRVEALRRRGIRTFAIGVTAQANGELLEQVARLGGTSDDDEGPGHFIVDNLDEFLEAIARVFASLETCACTPGAIHCADGREVECNDTGLGWLPPGRQCEGLTFEGIRTDLTIDAVEGGAFEVCHESTYADQNIVLREVLAACNGDLLLMTCHERALRDLPVAAMGRRDDVTFDVGDGPNAVHTHNGVDWYYSDEASWGFAPVGAGVARSTCDTAENRAEERLCWHTDNGTIRPGWSCGAARWLGGDDVDWIRKVYHRDGAL